MNTRQLLNKVLRGLRQDAIPDSTADISDVYQLLILQFLNEAKEEIEENWDWYALRATVTVTVAQGTDTYTLSAAGDADIDVNDRSRLLYAKNLQRYANFVETSSRTADAVPQVIDVTDSTEHRLIEKSLEWIERQHFLDDDEQNEPRYFAWYASGGFVNIRIWPIPEKARTLKLRFVIPQEELSDDDITTTLSIPARPVWTRALFKATRSAAPSWAVRAPASTAPCRRHCTRPRPTR
jgi:hypothetical protein